MIRVGMIGVIAVFLAMFVKKDKPEFALFVILGSCVLLLTLSSDRLSEVIGAIRRLEQYLGDGSLYIGILLKMVGITYVAEFGANLCRDAGYGSVASQIEFYGKLMLLAVSIPLLMTLIETIENI